MIEIMQRRATRLMVRNKPYQDRLQNTKLLSVPSRRIYQDILFLFKCLHSLLEIDIFNYLQFSDSDCNTYNLRNKKLTFKIIYARSNLFKFSFFLE